MAATITKSPALARVVRLLHEVESAIPANNFAARVSVELLLQRLSSKMSAEVQGVLRERGDSGRPRKPR